MGCSATTKVVEVPHVTNTIEQIHHYDSIYISDSTIVATKNDTIVIERWRTKAHYKEIVDTFIQVDSIPVIQEVETIVEVNKIHWWQELLMWIGAVAVVILIIKFKL